MKKTLKKSLILFAVLIIPFTSYPQTTDTLIRDDQITKMIQKSLFIVLQIEKGYIEKQITNRGINDDFYIWIDHYPAGFEPTQEILDLNLKLKYVSIYGLTKKQKKKGMYGIGFSGVRIDGNKIKLNFTGTGVHLKNNKMYVGVDGEGYLFEYEYSCESMEWVLTKMPKQLENE